MKKYGFTTIELLSVIVILAIIMGIAVIGLNYVLDKGNESFYKNIEQDLLLSGSEYFNNNRNEKPIDGVNEVSLKKLVDAGYIDKIVDKDGNPCNDGKVLIFEEDDEYKYEACLNECGGYTTETDNCKYEYDDDAPTCSISISREWIIIGKSDVNYNIVCNDNKHFFDSSIGTSNISLSSNVVSLGTPVKSNNGDLSYKYSGTITGKSVGETSFTLKEGAVSDGGKNTNSSVKAGETLKVYKEATEGNVSENLVYNGNDQVLISGGNNVTYSITTGKDAKTYTIIIKANDNSLFADGKSEHEVTVTISKNSCSCSITSISEMTYPESTSGTVTYNCTGDGTVNITSSNTNSISVSGNTLTAKGLASNITITAKQGEGPNYNACSGTKTINVTNSTYNISYELNGGTNYSGAPTNYTYGTVATINGTPSKESNTFNGWCTVSNLTGCSFSQSINTTTSGDKTYYAKWCQNCASVSNGKCTLTATTAGTCTYTTSCNTGYTISGNGTYNPTCTINSYTLTANANGGTIPATSGWTIASDSKTATKSIYYNADYGTLPTPTRSGYTFNGWFTAESGGTKVTESTTIGAGDVTIYAHWTASGSSCSRYGYVLTTIDKNGNRNSYRQQSFPSSEEALKQCRIDAAAEYYNYRTSCSYYCFSY